MGLSKVIVTIFILITIDTLTIALKNNNNNTNVNKNNNVFEVEEFDNKTIVPASKEDNKLNEIFKGVYADCVMKFSYSCIQKKTLLYIEELNSMSEVSIIGDYVKFVKLNTTVHEKSDNFTSITETDNKELELLINRAIDNFFKSHMIKFSALGNDITVPREIDVFVGRKKKKGGGGGIHGGDDWGKKKMMMMAMMCMKMKLMMMVPAMMGMMGIISFKGMMFSMLSFMLSKIMLLMKLLEKKGSAGFGGGAGGGDGGWAAAGGSGGAWMPTGGQDFGGGGYDANAQWQSRSIFEKLESRAKEPIITYVIPTVRYVNKDKKLTIDEVRRSNDFVKPKRRKRAVGNELYGFDRQILETIVGDYQGIIKMTNGKDSINNIANEIPVTNRNKMISELYKQYLLMNTNRKEINIGLNNKETYTNNNTRPQTININENKRLTNESGDEGDVSKKSKSRQKRGLLDILQNSYMYWMNKLLGIGNNRRAYTNPKYKIVNGLKYVYYPIRPVLKPKASKENQTSNKMKIVDEGFKPIIAAEDFDKGEILEAAESRMNRKKFNKMKNTVNDTMDDNPWE